MLSSIDGALRLCAVTLGFSLLLAAPSIPGQREIHPATRPFRPWTFGGGCDETTARWSYRACCSRARARITGVRVARDTRTDRLQRWRQHRSVRRRLFTDRAHEF